MRRWESVGGRGCQTVYGLFVVMPPRNDKRVWA